MIGDRYIFLPEHKTKAQKIVDHFNFKKGKNVILTIGGESGTGKSEVAYLVRSILHKQKNIGSVIYSLDDYYKTMWYERNEVRKKTNNIGIGEIKWGRLEHNLNNFMKDSPNTCMDILDKYLGHIIHCYYDASAADVAIIEGLYALNVKKAKYRTVLDGTYLETKKFRLKRMKEPQTEFRQLVLKKEHEACQSLLKKANLHI